MTSKPTKRPPQVEKVCEHCKKKFTVQNNRKDSAKFCSRECSSAHPRKHHTVRCRECGTEFALKKSQADRTIWGNFCSSKCTSAARSRMTTGDGNPNWKGRNFDSDGYRMHAPQASLKLGYGRMKLHQAVAIQAVGLSEIPKKLHVHHRDCDIQNNDPDNLQFLTFSDHKWIHKQYGSAALRAISMGDVDVGVASSWSDDPIRATGILMMDAVAQGVLMNYFREKFGSADIAHISSIKPVIVTFDVVDDLFITERGTGGFGSTGA